VFVLLDWKIRNNVAMGRVFLALVECFLSNLAIAVERGELAGQKKQNH
jgi:hypothetical protein